MDGISGRPMDGIRHILKGSFSMNKDICSIQSLEITKRAGCLK